MPLTFIHAADFHLGADLSRFGSEAARQLEASQFAALEKTGEIAREHQAAFILICGDLFDDRNPSPRILEKTVSIFGAFPNLPVFILPGTHDFLSDKSIYATGRLTGQRLVVLNNSIRSPYHLPELNCCLFFNCNRANRSAISPLDGISRATDNRFHIGLAHGSLAIRGLPVSTDFPIKPPEIAAAGLDYLALGHWHTRRIERFGQTHAAYSSIPQPLSFSDPETGSVLLIRIDDSKDVTIEPIQTSTVKFITLKERIYHPSDLIRLLEKWADRQTAIKIALQFSDKFIEHHKAAQIIRSMDSRYLVIFNGDNNLQDKVPESPNPPSGGDIPLLQSFLNELQRLREADSQERAHLYDQAATMGKSIIRGER